MKKVIFILFLFIILPLLSSAESGYEQFTTNVDRFPFILVNKQYMTLSLLDENGNPIKQYGIACGSDLGNKLVKGDNKTPEGYFHICQIINSSYLSHDFKDGKGDIPGAYGPWFFRLDVPDFNSIGIHGTHSPESIGTRTTEGCIRLINEDLIELKSYISNGTPVLILPDPILDSEWPDSTLNLFSSEDRQKDYYICYDPADSDAADSIYNVLNLAGKTCYYDRNGLDGGINHPAVLASAINDCKKFLLIHSDNACNSAYINSAVSFATSRKQPEDMLLYAIDEGISNSTWNYNFNIITDLNPTSSIKTTEETSRLNIYKNICLWIVVCAILSMCILISLLRK